MPHKMPRNLCRLLDNRTTFLTNTADTKLFFFIFFSFFWLTDMHRQSKLTGQQAKIKKYL